MKRVFIALTLLMLCRGTVIACDHPGTPNPVNVKTLDRNTVELDIYNTAKEGSGRDIWFMINNNSGPVGSFTQGHIANGGLAIFNIGNLPANTQQCFQVWARDDDAQGCESEQATGKVCTFMGPPYQNATGGGQGFAVLAGPGTPPGQPTCCSQQYQYCPSNMHWCNTTVMSSFPPGGSLVNPGGTLVH